MAAGTPVQNAVLTNLYESFQLSLWVRLEVQAALMATSLSGSCAQTLLRACIWWDTSLWAHKSIGVQNCLTPSK